MPQFHWSGRTKDGRTASGTIDATSKEAAVSALRAQNVMVTAISTRGVVTSSNLGQRLARVVLLMPEPTMGTLFMSWLLTVGC